MEPCKIIVNGAQGKMGQLAVATLALQSDFKVVGTLGRHDDLAESIRGTGAEIVVDLTCAAAVYHNTKTIIEAGASPVVGTTGLLADQYQALKHLSEQKDLGGIIVPNFSIGGVLMMHFAAIAASYMPEAEIIEAHHPHKQEAPSGTAIKTAEMIAKSRKEHPNYPCHELLPGARGARSQEVPIHSIRISGVLAEQEVIFGQKGETLRLCHQTLDRASFMPGLLLACRHVRQFDTLHYGLEHLLLGKSA